MKNSFQATVCSLLIITCTTFAQTAPPSTDIWLAPLNVSGTKLSVGTPVNITNRAGYDNQPSFLHSGTGILYTVMQSDPPGPQAPTQTEIFLYDLRTKKTSRMTRTAESEYSATVIPGGKYFSVVRVEPDSTQRLWRFRMDGTQPTVVLPTIKPVGYHAWVDSNTVALFVLGNPPTLQLATVSTGLADIIIGNIGRSLHKVPRKRAVSFVQKMTNEEWWIKQLDVSTRSVTSIVRTLPRSEDYAWTPDGIILMGQGSKLFSFKPGVSKDWTEVADFSSHKINGITRIAVSPQGNWIAFVATE
ncbi:MAG TPA: hypothetical protein VNL36_09380 [Bacteroidota bacterium]|nr:hypothetical protein [Bacteroidota bacterium]